MNEMKSYNADPNFNSNSKSAAETAHTAATASCLRVPFYCEENVWRLAYKQSHEQPDDKFFVVFISNAVQSVPMYHQLASTDPNQPCCWDYHVILLCRTSSDSHVRVCDLDSRLPPNCPLEHYLKRSFALKNHDELQPVFRVISAPLYLAHFASDRSHMYCNGKWNAPPPPYDCILPGPSNLKHYLNFTAQPALQELTIPNEALGVLLTAQELLQYNFSYCE
jgi:hypothetical protein